MIMKKVNSNSKVTGINNHDANVLKCREMLINMGIYDKVKNNDFGKNGYILLRGIPKVKGIVEIFKQALNYDNISGSGGRITIYKQI